MLYDYIIIYDYKTEEINREERERKKYNSLSLG